MKNTVSLIGRIGADVTIKEFDNNTKVCNISLAVDDSYLNDKKERVERVHWFNLVGQNKIAELLGKKFKKGDQLAINGKLKTRSYDNGQGQTVYVVEVLIQEIEFLACSIK